MFDWERENAYDEASVIWVYFIDAGYRLRDTDNSVLVMCTCVYPCGHLCSAYAAGHVVQCPPNTYLSEWRVSRERCVPGHLRIHYRCCERYWGPCRTETTSGSTSDWAGEVFVKMEQLWCLVRVGVGCGVVDWRLISMRDA